MVPRDDFPDSDLGQIFTDRRSFNERFCLNYKETFFHKTKYLLRGILFYVHPKGIEPLLQDPQSCVLSVERRVLISENHIKNRNS